MSPIAVRHDLRGRFGPARDQEARPTCLAFAMSDAHAATIGAPWTPLSSEYLFYHAKQRDSSPVDQGTTITAVREALEHEGQPAETGWPYLPHLPSDLSAWKPPAGVGPLFHRESKLAGSGFGQIWDAIENDRPVLIGMTISGAFFTPDADGIVDSTEAEDPHMKHAVVATATGDNANGQFVFVRNSWGTTWGLSGFAWVSERYLAPRIRITTTLK